MNNHYIYDIETYPNIFCIGIKDTMTSARWTHEISWRRNDLKQLILLLSHLRSIGASMVGFNNIGFDYPIIHYIIENQHRNITSVDIFKKADSIINCDFNDRFRHIIWDSDRHVDQIDLFKIHHFDNKAKMTSLKVLEFNMRSDNIKDLPYLPGSILSWDQCDNLREYMWNDINETEKFYHESKEQIEFRQELTTRYNRNFMNHNDTKIGKDYFIMQLENQVPGFNKKDQTHRDKIVVSDIIFPYIRFNNPEFNRILTWFNDQIVTDTTDLKKVFKDVSCTVNGFDFHFGAGGIHGSVDPCTIEANDEWEIIDIDVSSYYPNIAINNWVYPEHLGETFCKIYREVYEERKQHKKGTAQNAMLKLALNGVFGDSNNKYSTFYDPQYTLSITINGQLLLCMLAEHLMIEKDVQMVQINTDGLTIRCPKTHIQWVKDVCCQWEKLTRLELEYAAYSKMFIRDVNNYLALYNDGKIKRKGVYEWDLQWHQNHSALIVPKAVEQHLVYGKDLRATIENHQDIHDFMLRTKVPRSSRLVWVDYDGTDHQQQNVSRYYISILGGDLVKIMPPLKGKTVDRRIGINTGWKTTICNDINECNPDDIEFEWYIQEAEKLIKPLRR